jgi:UPF0755 protein
MKKLMKYLKTFLVIMTGLAVAGAAAAYMNSPPSMSRDEIFRIREGESLVSVAERLHAVNCIRSECFFTALGRATGMSAIKPGKYRIQGGSSSVDILDKLYRGDILRRKVTIPEGFNIFQIAERLDEQGIVNRQDFHARASDRGLLRSIGISADGAEGYLFPDTYIFPEESEPGAGIKTMYDRLQTVLGGLDLSAMNALGLNLHSLLTLASMIEKEAKIHSEQVYISGVFHQRLAKGMKMDCDPTVRYAVKRFTGPIYLRDLQSDSPYNTYVRYGLPPGPICSPGRKAISAALNPRKTEFLYFVSRNDGSHYFSRNLKEHNRAVQYYQRGRKNGFVDTQRL